MALQRHLRPLAHYCLERLTPLCHFNWCFPRGGLPAE